MKSDLAIGSVDTRRGGNEFGESFGILFAVLFNTVFDSIDENCSNLFWQFLQTS